MIKIQSTSSFRLFHKIPSSNRTKVTCTFREECTRRKKTYITTTTTTKFHRATVAPGFRTYPLEAWEGCSRPPSPKVHTLRWPAGSLLYWWCLGTCHRHHRCFPRVLPWHSLRLWVWCDAATCWTTRPSHEAPCHRFDPPPRRAHQEASNAPPQAQREVLESELALNRPRHGGAIPHLLLLLPLGPS